MNELTWLVSTILSSGAVSGIVSGIVSASIARRSERDRNNRSDAALRRHLRAAARNLGTQVALIRQFGFINDVELSASLNALEAITRDSAIEVALTDDASEALHESVELCKLFVGFAKNAVENQNNPMSNLGSNGFEQRQGFLSGAIVPTLRSLRQYFVLDGSASAVSHLDDADKARRELMRP